MKKDKEKIVEENKGQVLASDQNGAEVKEKPETKKEGKSETLTWDQIEGATSTEKTEAPSKQNDKEVEKGSQYNEIDDFLKEYKQAAEVDMSSPGSTESTIQKPKRRRGRKKKKEDMIVSGEIISGALFLTLIDMLLPMAIASVNNLVDKKNKINYNDLRLKQSQLNELEPIADKVMEEIQIKTNPMAILIMSFVSIYGLNFVNAKYGIDG